MAKHVLQFRSSMTLRPNDEYGGRASLSIGPAEDAEAFSSIAVVTVIGARQQKIKDMASPLTDGDGHSIPFYGLVEGFLSLHPTAGASACDYGAGSCLRGLVRSSRNAVHGLARC